MYRNWNKKRGKERRYVFHCYCVTVYQLAKLAEKQREKELRSLFKTVDSKKKDEQEEEEKKKTVEEVEKEIEEEIKEEAELTIEEIIEKEVLSLLIDNIF